MVQPPRLMIIAERGYCLSDQAWQRTIGNILSVIEDFPTATVQIRNKHAYTSWYYIKPYAATWLETHPTQCILNGTIFPKIQCGRHLPEAQLGTLFGRHGLTGASIHSLDALTRSIEANVHYVQYGAIYPTSKPVVPLGLNALRILCATSALPVLAVGGINSRARVRSCIENGAYGVSVGSWILQAKDPDLILRQITEEIHISMSST